jgi:hypothetical protein
LADTWLTWPSLISQLNSSRIWAADLVRLTLRITSGALSDRQRRLVHAMLDGVFECGNHFFDVRRQLAMTLDVGPQRDQRSQNQGAVQRNRIEIVVEVLPPTTMKRITRPPHSRPTVPPVARPTDVRTPLVGEKHVSPAIEALCLALQPACARGQRCKIGIVGNDHEHIDVFRIKLSRDDRAQHGNSTDTGNLSDSRNESAQRVEQLLTVTLGWLVHRRLNPAVEPR